MSVVQYDWREILYRPKSDLIIRVIIIAHKLLYIILHASNFWIKTNSEVTISIQNEMHIKLCNSLCIINKAQLIISQLVCKVKRKWVGIKSLRLREEHAAHGTITKQFLLLCTFVHIHIWRHEQNINGHETCSRRKWPWN